MNNQIILSALESQVVTKKAELESYETSTSEPALKAATQEVLESLRDNVCALIPSIMLDESRIEIMKCSNPNSWSALTVSLQNDWRSEDRKLYAKMNWYGSSATTQEENILNDVRIFGAVAAKLAWIEYEFLNNWRPKLLQINKPVQEMSSEIRKIDSSIYDVKYKIRQEGIDTYKTEGFFCTITPILNIEMDWEAEKIDPSKGRPYILKSSIPNIKLSIGRSKWDYVHTKSFKVIKTNKYKTTLEVTLANNSIVEHTVTAKSFNDFIDEVYNWQTERSKEHNDKTTEKFNTRYATK
jgi:hypothetical protein